MVRAGKYTIFRWVYKLQKALVIGNIHKDHFADDKVKEGLVSSTVLDCRFDVGLLRNEEGGKMVSSESIAI